MTGQYLPVISIVVAVYNGAETLQRCIDSVSKQTYPNKELIIIDGGSGDGTVEVLESNHGKISYWISESDKGIYHAWNKGLEQAHGEWICFLGADDFFWSEGVLDKYAQSFVQGGQPPRIKLAYGQVAVLSRYQELLYKVGGDWCVAKPQLRDIMSVPHPGMMHHRSWFDHYGNFDISYRIAGDYEMLLRGWPQEEALYIPDFITVGMAQGGISSSPGSAIKQLQEVWRAQRHHGFTFPHTPLIAAFARVSLRLLLHALLGQRIAYYLLDIGRRVLGKPSYWTKL